MLDLRCYLVTGPGDAVGVAAAAARGGAGVVQVRSKPISPRDLLSLATEVARAVARANPATRVLIDDRVDIAAALMHRGEHVHGVHLGQDDLPVRDARAILGPRAIIGLTTGTLPLVEAANEVAEAIDYIGAGPYRPTPTKDSGRPPLGVAGYIPLVQASRVPVVAIGDVTAQDAPALADTGVAGVALSRGLMRAEDPEAVTRSVLGAFA
ncbi:thiamine phosphate synthase [Corynebacterium oculi]|uniref:Thiamine-phosphate synthase n=1 Tax=Corynebacterium oculi TaxID=1544416 RepID=A0A0Q0YSF9_9CORY|nr:thiamine phosphate synthase [Corynebacterium oculi]KQB85320.1 Thiamine-phosphate synthase [Corynebacterium oculi]